jgi:integrase
MNRSCDPARRCLRPEDWPPADRAAWSRALSAEDPFDGATGRALRWKPSTRKMIESAYGRWINHLLLRGDLDPHASPRSRATRERIGNYAKALTASGLADYTRALNLRNLGQALEAMDPSFDATWIKRGGDRIHSHATPTRKIESRLPGVAQVLRLAEDMMDAAEADRFRTPVDRAVLYRDGLLIGFLVHRPLRRANLAAMALGQHLICRDGVWSIHVSGVETKNGAPIDGSWPPSLTSRLERYLEVHRAAFFGDRCGEGEPALWIGVGGRPMGPAAISFQVAMRTRQEFGVALNVHSFRHLLATTIAEADPEHMAFAAGALGHSSLATNDAHYNLASMGKAAERYQSGIVGLRRRIRRPRGGDRDTLPLL